MNFGSYKHLVQEMKGRKGKTPSTMSGGVSSRTRARKAVSDGNELAREDVVHQDSTTVRETTVVSLSVDSESEDMSSVSSKVFFAFILIIVSEKVY